MVPAAAHPQGRLPARAQTDADEDKTNAVIDYLYFATQNTAGLGIANDIFRKYGQP